MPRSKNAVASRARRKKILDQAKGFYGKRKNVYTVAKNVLEKGLTYSYVGRKLKKREYRTLWIARINAAVRAEGLTYSQFINLLGGIQSFSLYLILKIVLYFFTIFSRISSGNTDRLPFRIDALMLFVTFILFLIDFGDDSTFSAKTLIYLQNQISAAPKIIR